MVFHVAGAESIGALRVPALEFVEDLLVGLAHHGGQHVEASAVRHADHDFLHAQRAAALDDLFQRRHGSFPAIEAETLGARIALVQEAFEGFRFDQLGQDRLLALIGEGNALVRAFDPFLQPGFFLRIGDVHELDADRGAVGPLQDLQHFRNCRHVEAEIAIDEDFAVHVPVAEAIGGRREFRLAAGGVEAQRVELGGEVATHTIGTDHHDRVDRILHRTVHILVGRCRAGALDLFLEFGFQQRPVAVKGSDLFVQRRAGPVAALPGRAFGIALCAR